jgi:hypothetical protein
MRQTFIRRRGAAEFVWLSGAFLLGTAACCLTDAVADASRSQVVTGPEMGLALKCLFGLAGLTGLFTALVLVCDALAFVAGKRSV